MTKLNPYIHFNGKASEAMTFYKDCLGGELFIQTVGESPMAEKMPNEVNKVMHSNLTSGAITILASDMMDAGEFTVGNNMSLTLQCESEEEIKKLFEKFAAGGEIKMPLADQFWGAIYGEIVDKFGVLWLFNFDKTLKA